MVSVIGLIGILFFVAVIGGGIGFVFWIKTRPKKETWDANIYQLGEGVRPPVVNSRGEIISDLKLQDLRPYAKDILEKVEKDTGVTIYRLNKMNKVTPAVESDVVEYWGEGKRSVDVLLYNDSCTLLKKGYDKIVGQKIFTPLPHSRISLIKQELSIRKDRLQKEKDILQAITPWIVTGVCVLGLIALSYILISGFIQISDNLKEGQLAMAKSDTERIDKLWEIEQMRSGVYDPENHDLGAQKSGGTIVIKDG